MITIVLKIINNHFISKPWQLHLVGWSILDYFPTNHRKNRWDTRINRGWWAAFEEDVLLSFDSNEVSSSFVESNGIRWLSRFGLNPSLFTVLNNPKMKIKKKERNPETNLSDYVPLLQVHQTNNKLLPKEKIRNCFKL